METNDNSKYIISMLKVNDIVKWCEDNGFTGGKSSDGIYKVSNGRLVTNSFDRWHYERVENVDGIDINEYVDIQLARPACYMAMVDVHAVIDRVAIEGGRVFDFGSTIASAKHWVSSKEEVERIISLSPQVIAMAKRVRGMG